HVGLARALVGPLLGRLVRRVAAAGNIIDEEWRIRRRGVQLLHMADRFVRHIGDEVVPWLPDPRIYLGVVPEQIRRPLIGFTAHEAIEILKAHARWPLVERTGDAVLERWGIVVLAKPGRSIAVAAEDRSDGCLVRRDDRVVTRVSRRQFRSHAETRRVM